MDRIAQDNPRAAVELDEEFEAKGELARRNPQSYRTGRVKGTREIVVRPTYLMVYGIEDEGSTVAVLRVFQTARDWSESDLTPK